MTGAIEQGNRRAEIEGGFVVFLRVTGKVRRSTRLAQRWVKFGKQSRPVLH